MIADVVKVTLLAKFDFPTLTIFSHQESIVVEKGDVMCKKPVHIPDMSTNQSSRVPTDRVLGMKFMIDLTVFGDEIQSADSFLNQYMNDGEGFSDINIKDDPFFPFGVNQNFKFSVMLNRPFRDYVEARIEGCLHLFQF